MSNKLGKHVKIGIGVILGGIVLAIIIVKFILPNVG